MSRLEELVLKTLLKTRDRKTDGPPIAGEDWAAYSRWQFDSSAPLFAKYPGFDVAGKTVLEIGCGTGGRSAWLASAGAKRVVGVDINAPEIEIARRLVPELYPQLKGKLEYVASQEDSRLDLGVFDIVVLVDCLEHVVSPPSILRLAHGYTAEGGRCYVSLFGWYHANGSHYGMVPFVNLLFSDEAILNVTRWWVSRPEYVPSRFDSDPPVERWRGLYDLRQRPGEYLNKITLREMKRLMKHSLFRSARMHVVGFTKPNPLFKVLNALRNVPVLQEAAHSYVVLEFVK